MEKEGMQVLTQSASLEILLWIVIAGVVLGFTIYSAVLIWHWKMYSTGKFTTVSNIIMFLSVGIFFIMLMAGSALTYSLL